MIQNPSDSPVTLEVIACTLDDAKEAERGGAHRLEIISHFELGGLTPSIELVKTIRDAVSLPLRVMLRESEGFEIRDTSQIARLEIIARELNALDVEGIVLGFLRSGRIDLE